MTEIRCSECGSPNPSQSRYCNRCGAILASETTHLCPTCNTPNPINLLYCDNCGTRLVDDSGEQDAVDDEETQSGSRSQPFSLPARPPGQTGNLDVSADLPDWLVTGDFSEDDFQDLSEGDELQWLRAAQEGEAWEDDDAPTLEELSSDHAPRDDLPTWLMDDESENTIFGGDKSTDELFMASLGSGEDDEDEAPVDDEPPPGESDAAVSELESWLSEMEEDEAEQDVGESEPPESRPLEADASEQPEDPPTEMSEDNFLQWLSEIHEEEAAGGDLSVELPDEPTDMPDWLSRAVPELGGEDTGKEDRTADDMETPDIPDWLTEESEAGDEFVAEIQEEPGQSAVDEDVEEDIPEDDFLQWLDSLDAAVPGMAEDEPTTEEEQQLIPEVPLDIEDPDVTQLPLDAPETPQPDVQDAAEFTEEDFALPDWLGELSEPDDQAEETVAPSSVEDLPDWLQDLAPSGADVKLPYVSGSEAELAREDQGDEPGADTAPGDDVDLWSEAEDIQEGELPDWLGDIAPEAEATGVDQGDAFSAETALESDADLLLDDDDIQEGELPDWLDGVTAELDAAPQETHSEGAPELGEASAQEEFARADDSRGEFDTHTEDDLEDQQVSTEDLPDWFSDVLAGIETVGDEDAASDMSSVPEQLAGSDLPEWLDSPFSDDEEAAEPTPIEEIPEWLRAPLQEKLARAAAERGIEEASLEGGDEWRELLAAPPSSTEHTAGDVRRENAMAWLEELRATSPSEDVSEPEPDPVTGDPGSPVAGIGGAIDVAYGVTQAGRKRRPTQEATAGEQEQQVLLLRQLARGDRVQTTEILPLATGVGALPLPVRITLAALLLAVVVLGLFATDAVAGLVPQAADDPALTAMEPLLDQATGEPVLVVFDYTPAMAGALQPAAIGMLQQLRERESYPLITSQSAAGLALASGATADADLTESGDLGLVSGGALGVRQVARCMRHVAQCETLFGQSVASDTGELLANTSTLVLITGERDNLVAWIEQMEGNDSVTLAAVVTPMLEPVAAPYRLSGQLASVVVANGAATADATANGNSASTALALSHWFAIVVIAAGALFYLVSDMVRSVRS